DELSLVRSEPKGGSRNVQRLAHASKRNGCYETRAILRRVRHAHELLQQAGLPNHRTDRIHPNVIRCELDGHRLRYDVGGPFGTVVPHQSWPRSKARGRADINDRTAPLGAHRWNR